MASEMKINMEYNKRFKEALAFYKGVTDRLKQEREIKLTEDCKSIFDDIIDVTIEENAFVVYKGIKVFKN